MSTPSDNAWVMDPLISHWMFINPYVYVVRVWICISIYNEIGYSASGLHTRGHLSSLHCERQNLRQARHNFLVLSGGSPYDQISASFNVELVASEGQREKSLQTSKAWTKLVDCSGDSCRGLCSFHACVENVTRTTRAGKAQKPSPLPTSGLSAFCPCPLHFFF